MTNGLGGAVRKKRMKNPKKWTVMVYFAGDNNLSEEMIYAIKEMYRVGVTSDVDVIVQFDPSAIGAPVRRYVITREELDKAVAAIGQQEPSHSARGKTNVITGLDVDGNIIETLGIPLNGKAQRAKSKINARGFSALPPQVQQLRDVQKLPDRLDYENSADPEVLEHFIIESIRYFPSEHYMVVLSGHGSGALGDFLPDDNPNRPGEPLQSLSIPSLARVFKNVKTVLGKAAYGNTKSIEILGMDSCLMSMAEAGNELKSYVDYLVGSEGFVLNTGWPYHRILQALNLNPTAEPLALAQEIVKKYISYYDDYEVAGASTDQSVCQLAGLGALIPHIQNLAGALIKGLEHTVLRDEIVLAHWEAQSYKTEQYTDLYDFCDRLQRRCIEQTPELEPLRGKKDDTEILKKLEETFPSETKLKSKDAKTVLQVAIKLAQTSVLVKEAIAAVVKLSCYTGPAFQYSHGFSVYFPWSESKEDLDKYQLLTFAKSGWGAFLKEYVVKTRRPERPQLGKKREGQFNPNPNNEVVETLLFVRAGTSGNPKGPASIGSAKNPPVDWKRGKCGRR
jgi:hypothetical protein